MTALRSGGVLARALLLLVALSGAALAQAPTASDWRNVAATWVELCTAPCRITNGSSYAVRVAVGSSAPTSDDAAAAVLASGDATRDFAVAGLKVYGRALATPTRVVIEPLGGASGGSGGSGAKQNTDGSLAPPTAAAGKIVPTSVALSANVSTQLVAANDQRIALEIQCDGTAIVGISRTGATLTGATTAPLVIPAASYPLYTMPVATLTAVTAYTGTAQTCRVTEYLR